MVTTGSRELVISLHDEDYDFIRGHIRNGVNVLPESFLLFLVWEKLAMSTEINYSRLPVKFNDIQFHNEAIVDPENSLKLSININRTGNRFEVSCKENILVSGFISFFDGQIKSLNETVNINDLKICGQDIYKILHRRGHLYKDNFQTIFSMSIDCTQGTIRWTDEWRFFIDALIQFNILAEDSKQNLKPKFIQELIIDVDKHRTCKKIIYKDTVCFNAKHDKVLGVTRCGGIEMKNIVFENIPIPQREPDVLTSKVFCTHFPTINYDLTSALNILMQLVTENTNKECLKVVQVTPSFEISLLDCIQSVVSKTSADIKFDFQEIDEQQEENNIIDVVLHKTLDLLVVYNLLRNKQKMLEIHNKIHSNAFLLTLENAENMITARQKHFNVISAIRINSKNIMILLKKRNEYETYGGVSCVKVDNYYKFSWLKKVYSDLGSKKKVILLSVNRPLNGITGIVTFLSKKYGNRISLVKIEDIDAPIFDQENIFYKEQLEKNLTINVLREGQWGSYYQIPIKVFTERKNYALDIECPGDFNSLKWSEISTIPTHRTIKVNYAGLSLRDVKKANEKDSIDGQTFGMDFSGIDNKITCSSDKSYIVFGDNKELALEIIDFLVQRNVKNIILHLKHKNLSGYGEFKLQSWIKQNVRLKLVFDDILTDEGCSNVFNETTQMGPIEGIFVILDHIEERKLNEEDDFSNSFSNLVSGIVKIEATARESTLDTLRYFSIISKSTCNVFEEYINSVCEELCRARNAIGLPGLLFNVVGLNEFPNKKNDLNPKLRPQDFNTLYNGLETSLALKLNNASTLNITDRKCFMKPIEISDIPHFNGISDISPHQLICENTEKYKRLQRKNEETIKQKENFNGGLAAFYNFIDNDVYRATETFIPMSTKIFNTFPDEHELDPNGSYLMLIPGFEGHSRIFKSLCERLKIKAFTIQLDPVAKNKNIPEMAGDILRLIKKRLILKNKFYLLGYSFGINIALELTNMLEKEGHVGIIYCLDSSPDVIKKQVDAYIGIQSNVQLQNSIIKHMFTLVGKDVNNLSEHLNSKRDWNEKIEYFIQEVKKLVNYPHEYIRNLLNSLYERIIIARNYNPTYKLNSDIILIRGIAHPDSATLPYDYNLLKYTNSEIKIFEIESDTAMAPFDDSVPNIVNKLLDPSVIEEFKNSSSCEVYLMEKAGLKF